MSPTTRFWVTLLFGWCGAHKFADKKIGMGFLYLFTFGLLYVGWIYDTVGAAKAMNAPKRKKSHAAAPAARLESVSMRNIFSPYETAFIDGASRQYRYEFDFHPTNANLLEAVLSGYTTYSRQDFDCTVKNNLLCIEFAGDILGTANFKVNMASDFLGRGDPVRVFILEATKETGCYRAAIDFYQDRRKRNDWREQTVVALNAYKGAEKQETIACISAGQELSISDELTGQGHPLPVYYQSEPIGVLPASIQRRVEDEGGELCTFERSECVGQNSKGDPIEQPYIRIYW